MEEEVIAEDIAKMVYEKTVDLSEKDMREGRGIAVYIDIPTWLHMMEEVKRGLAPYAIECSATHGRQIMGCPIYRVDTDGHGIQVCVVKT